MTHIPPHKSRKRLSAKSRNLTALCSSLTLSALLGASSAAAQEVKAAAAAPAADEAVQLGEFVVSGMRNSVVKAQEVKRASPQFIDVIVSEDIGKFPDNNIVESLQRLPGVQVTDYSGGNITSVTVRGMPDVTTTLNGRNIFTASGLSLSLQDVPASLLKQVDVKKTRAAADIETGIAGVIDIQTFRPFDFPNHKVGVAVKGTYNEQRDGYDPNVSALFSNRWKVGSEGKFGALFNVSYLTTTYRDQSATPGAMIPFAKGAQPAPAWPEPYARIFPDVVPWTPGLDNGLSTAPGSRLGNTNVEYVLARDAIFFNETLGKTKRPAANLSLQYSPNKNTEYTFEMFYLGYRNERFSNLLFSFVDWWGAPTAATNDVTLFPGTNIVQRRGYIGDVFSFTSGDYVTGKTDSMQYSLGGKWTITPNFKLSSELVFQDSEFNGTNLFIRANRNVRNDVSVNFNAGDGVPSFRYLDVVGTAVNEGNPANASTWGLAHLWDQGFKNKGNATTFTEEGLLDVNWGWIKKLKVGLRVDDRKASEASRAAEGDPITGTDLASFNSRMPGIVSINSGFFDGRADIPSSWASVNGEYANNNVAAIRKLYSFSSTSRWNLKESFNIDEITSAGYLQVDKMQTEFAGHKFSGQFGVRFVNIATSMTFTDTAAASYNKTYGRAGVSKFLPSMAFNYEITDNFIARLGYGETIRRPSFGDLNPLITYTRDVTNIGYGTAGGGNPDLKPTTSKNFDFALEYYFNEASMVHVNLFKRNIEGLVVGTRKRVTYTDSIGAYDYILSQPGNASNGELNGFEIGGKYYPKSLPGFLQGLGVEGSFTHLNSSQDVPETDSTGKVIRIRNTEFFLVSPNSYNGTLAYEHKKISARVSYAWRSAFHHHNEAPLFANPLAVYNAAERSLTAQFSYKVSNDLTVSLEGTNLTDDVQHSYYGENGRTTNNFGNWIVGRTISASVRYSF